MKFKLCLIVLTFCAFIRAAEPTAIGKEVFVYGVVQIGGGSWDAGWLNRKIEKVQTPKGKAEITIDVTANKNRRWWADDTSFEIKRVRCILDNKFEFVIETEKDAQVVLKFLKIAKGTLSLTKGTLYIGSRSWANTQNGSEKSDFLDFQKLIQP